ncbi:MAG TPA: HD domain-containing phosphohydrolase [Clostridium sp.]
MNGNILIIDDSPVERKIIGQAIKKRFQDVNIFEADNGLDISDKILENNINACILDIIMPIKDGFQILKEMKEDSNLMDIPVIICTGISNKQGIEKALSLGAYDYFSKPLSEEVMKILLPLKIKNAIDLMRRKEEIIYLSYHDKLTGLYNRRYSEDEMNRLDTERNLPVSLIMGDVNGLKLTNDAFGHEAGDKLLKKIADVIKSECKKDEIIARIGGDEFLIILPKTSGIEVEKIIDRIKHKCDNEKEGPIKPSISFGYSVKEQVDEDIMNVYKVAEDRMYNNKLTESKSIRSSIILSLINILHERSNENEAHCNRLKELCDEIGKKLGLTIDVIDNLKLLSLLHDIGMTAIPEYIYAKSMNLTLEEESILKNHCEIGYRIANALPDVAIISGDILSHHEKWDGSGYPQGLKGEDIPLNSRIISVLDTYDTMVNGKNPVSKNEALEFITNNSGIYFDTRIVDVFLKVLN